jgi:hypothetical protein
VRGERALDDLAVVRLPARLRSRRDQVRHVGGWPTSGDSQCGPGI